MAQKVAMIIKLLKPFLVGYTGKCGDIIEIRTNMGEWAT